jgi:arylsulfatase
MNVEDNKPNILFIMTDQQRWDALGATGDWVNTPNLDSLAEEGFLFSNCYTNSPVCAPARISLASGLYPHNHGLWHNNAYDLPAGLFTWMKAARNNGYRTSLFGKAHLRQRHNKDIRTLEHFMRRYGFDDVNEIVGPRACTKTLSHMTDLWEREGHWQAYIDDYAERFAHKPHIAKPSTLPLELYADSYIGQRAWDYLKGYQHQKPWCLMLSFGGPHEPWDAPEPYASMYRPEDMPPPRSLGSGWDEIPESTLQERLQRAWKLDPEDVAKLRANYAGNVTLIDDQVGRIIELLKQRGEYENTWIVFTSDHGEFNGDYGLLYKNSFFDSAARVPLIVRPPSAWQSREKTGSSDVMVEMFDLGATIADIVGAKVPSEYFAKSLLPYLRGDRHTHREFAMVEFKGELLYVDPRWKMMINKEAVPCMLIDRGNDPEEAVNLVGGVEQGVEARLASKLFSRLLSTQNSKPLVSVERSLAPNKEQAPARESVQEAKVDPGLVSRFLSRFI